MTDSKTPDWVKGAVHALKLHRYFVHSEGADGHVSQALLSAYERGRKEGIEETAAWHDAQARRHTNIARGYEEQRHEWGGPISQVEIYADLSADDHATAATAIRQLLEVKG